MYLLYGDTSFFRQKIGTVILFALSFLLISCDFSGDTDIQLVDSDARISDKELAQQQIQTPPEPNTYYFGFDLRASPQEDAAQYTPFLNYLESATGYFFKLHFTPQNSSTGEELGQDKIQFAAMGAAGFLQAQLKYDVIPLVRGLNHQGKAEYQSVLITRPSSSIQNISEIKSRKLAFGSKTSTQGHLIPLIMLKKNGIALKDLKTYAFTGSHQNCAEAVVSGKYDVCGIQDQLAEQLVAEGVVNIIYRSDYYPSSGIVANASIPAVVVAKIKQALLDFKPQGINSKGLYHWERTEMPKGFVSANVDDYANLRQWLNKLDFVLTDEAQVQALTQ